jgi:hypothetical protein
VSDSASELGRVEAIIDTAGIAARIEALLPIGVRPRQLRVRTLLVGMVLTMLSGRGALLKNVHRTLLGLPEIDQHRLGVITQWPEGPHTLSYRQLEYTWQRVVRALSKDTPDGAPSPLLSHVLDQLLEASVQVLGQPASSSYAVDWTDLETWARPPRKAAGGEQHQQAEQDEQPRAGSDPEAAFGHRNTNHPAKNEIFYGYYLQAVTTVNDEDGQEVPELARRMQLASCAHDPPAMLTPVITRMHQHGIPVGELLADSGYSHRVPETWALPLRALGISLIQDLHPHDRGPKGTHMGATCSNGNLYCPATPTSLLTLSPLHPGATQQQTLLHDQQCSELAHYKLTPISGYDTDGYRRVACPAAGKLRCPLHPQSMTLAHDRPTISQPPEHPPVCCQQKTITVPPTINAKTVQKHDYPSPQHRASYKRRTAAERTFSSLSDRATNDLGRGWCRLTGLTPIALLTATAITARNIRTTDAFNTRQAANQRRAVLGLPPKTRARRRTPTQDLISAAAPP